MSGYFDWWSLFSIALLVITIIFYIKYEKYEEEKTQPDKFDIFLQSVFDFFFVENQTFTICGLIMLFVYLFFLLSPDIPYINYEYYDGD